MGILIDKKLMQKAVSFNDAAFFLKKIKKNIKILFVCKIFIYFCTPITKGAIAQLVEHRTENPGVPGSIPGGTTNPKLCFGFCYFIKFFFDILF